MWFEQVARLEEAGYLRVDKGRVGRRSRTWLALSPNGAGVYRRHVQALHPIAAR